MKGIQTRTYTLYMCILQYMVNATTLHICEDEQLKIGSIYWLHFVTIDK